MTGDWFLIRSKHHSGDSMAAWRGDLLIAGVETYYPMVRELRRVPRADLSPAQRRSGIEMMRHRDVPFLPRLVFARGRQTIALAMPGAIGLVTMNERPMHFSPRAIAELQNREVDGVIHGGTPWERLFRAGDTVEVINGAFSNFVGIVEAAPDLAVQELDPDARLKLTLNFLGQYVRADMRLGDVVKVEQRSHPGSHAASHAVSHGGSAKRIRDSNPA